MWGTVVGYELLVVSSEAGGWWWVCGFEGFREDEGRGSGKMLDNGWRWWVWMVGDGRGWMVDGEKETAVIVYEGKEIQRKEAGARSWKWGLGCRYAFRDIPSYNQATAYILIVWFWYGFGELIVDGREFYIIDVESNLIHHEETKSKYREWKGCENVKMRKRRKAKEL
jgi:hypothetical protein